MITLLVDTSGGMMTAAGVEKTREHLAHVLRHAGGRVRLVEHNREVLSDQVVRSVEEYRPQGGGGTDYLEPLEYLAQAREPVEEGVIALTDLLGTFPVRAPRFPLLWVVEGYNPPVAPFGSALPEDAFGCLDPLATLRGEPPASQQGAGVWAPLPRTPVPLAPSGTGLSPRGSSLWERTLAPGLEVVEAQVVYRLWLEHAEYHLDRRRDFRQISADNGVQAALDTLALRGFTPAEAEVEGWRSRALESPGYAQVVLRIPGMRLDEADLGQLWRRHASVDVRSEILAHPAAGPTLWREALQEQYLRPVPKLLTTFSRLAGARRLPEVFELLARCHSHADILERIAEDAPADRMAEVVKTLLLLHPDSGERRLLGLLSSLSPEGRARVPDAVFLPLLQSDRAETRLQAMTLRAGGEAMARTPEARSR